MKYIRTSRTKARLKLRRGLMSSLRGLPETLQKLEDNVNTQIDRVRAGVLKAGLFLQRESQKRVPVWQGNLKNSAYTQGYDDPQGQGKFFVEVGYTAEYAVYVHENLNNAHGTDFNTKHRDKILAVRSRRAMYRRLSHNRNLFADQMGKYAKMGGPDPYWFFRGPNQMAKFLEIPARIFAPAIQRIIREEATRK